MSNAACFTPHPLHREGTTQPVRTPAALGLHPATGQEYVSLDEKTVADKLAQSAAFASYLTYYSSQCNPDGDWQPFFEELFDFASGQPTAKFSSLAELEKAASLSPHLSLLITFLNLLDVARPAFNNLKTAHLQFFYKTVLGLLPKPPVPDKVALLFEPEKGAPPTLVPAGTVLKAGTGPDGKPLQYKTTADLVVNNATVAALKTVFVKRTGGAVQRLYASADAPLQNKVTGTVGWRTFGSPADAQLSTIGFAIASPLLNLKEGRRRISFHLPGIEALDRKNLSAEYTTDKGWATAEVDVVPGVDGSPSAAAKGFLLIRLDAGLPPALPYNEAVHKAGMDTPHPVLRISLRNTPEAAFSAGYAVLSACRPSAITLNVSVAGVKSLVLQNDLGLIDPVKPFQPFGPAPVKHKSSLYIGSTEVFNRYLQSFHLSLNWKGIPGNLATYYKGYDKAAPGFTAQWAGFTQGHPPGKVSVLKAGVWEPLTLNAGTNYQSTNPPKKLTANTFKPDLRAAAPYSYTPLKAYTADARNGFIKLELGFDFGHRWYTNLLATAMIQKVKTATTPLPKPPYTPELASLHLDYTASATIDFSALSEHRLYQLHPFGFAEVNTAGQPVVPVYSEEGSLLIGLSGLSSPQAVSLFFALLPDSGNPDSAINSGNAITWQTLSGNAWLPLDAEVSVLSNTTHGFTTAGIIQLAVPAAALSAHTTLADGLVWIKASVAQGADAYPLLTGISTQAAEAVWVDANNAAHLAQPLPAGTITKPDVKIKGIKGVLQPYPSYNGRPVETEAAFHTRVAEQLRHKDRAWNVIDYERLLLNRFPQAYKIKCISHTDATSEYSVGKTLIVALPNPSQTSFQNPLMPRMAKRTLEEMKAWIKGQTSPFAHTDVVNPVYEPLRVECSIKLLPAFSNEAFYATQLKNELTGFLAPWTVAGAARLQFGGTLYGSAIINFIEERPYVDYVTDFAVFKTGAVSEKMGEAITASRESAILTSVPAALHRINTAAVC